MPSWVASASHPESAVEGVYRGVVEVDADDEGAEDQKPVVVTPEIIASASEGKRGGDRERWRGREVVDGQTRRQKERS